MRLGRIIEPLASRCSKFRFKPLDTSSTALRLAQIASAENISLSQPVIDALITTSAGDLRRSITYLQSASRLANSTNPPTEITPQEVQEIAGVVPDDVVYAFARTVGIDVVGGMDVDVDGGGTGKAKEFKEIRESVRRVVREGYSASQLFTQASLLLPSLLSDPDKTNRPLFLQLHDLIVWHPTLPALHKAKSAMVLAEADKALCDGADEELWMLEVALQIHKAVSVS